MGEFIKIQVVRHDGAHEVLTLTCPIRISGKCITTSTGFEHFFTADGAYDGWGMPFSASVPCGEDPMETAMPMIEAIDAEREIILSPEKDSPHD